MTDLTLEVLTKEEFLEQYPNINIDLTNVDNVTIKQEDGKVSFCTEVTVGGKPLKDLAKDLAKEVNELVNKEVENIKANNKDAKFK